MLDDSLRFTVPRLQRSIHVSGAIHSVNSYVACGLVDALKTSSKSKDVCLLILGRTTILSRLAQLILMMLFSFLYPYRSSIALGIDQKTTLVLVLRNVCSVVGRYT